MCCALCRESCISCRALLFLLSSSLEEFQALKNGLSMQGFCTFFSRFFPLFFLSFFPSFLPARRTRRRQPSHPHRLLDGRHPAVTSSTTPCLSRPWQSLKTLPCPSRPFRTTTSPSTSSKPRFTVVCRNFIDALPLNYRWRRERGDSLSFAWVALLPWPQRLFGLNISRQKSVARTTAFGRCHVPMRTPFSFFSRCTLCFR